MEKQYDAGAYKASRSDYPWFVMRYLAHYVTLTGKRVLDIGCGTGISTRQLARAGALVTGIDPSGHMLLEAKKELETTPPAVGGIEYRKGYAEKLWFPDGSFDVVCAFNAFHNVEPEPTLAEARRVLRPGGTLFIVNMFGRSFTDGYRRVLEQFVPEGLPLPHFEEPNWDPITPAINAGFTQAQIQEWSLPNAMSLENAITFVRSTKYWQKVPEASREDAAKALETHFKTLEVPPGGPVRRSICVIAVRAYRQ